MSGIGDMIMRQLTKKGVGKAMKSGKKMLDKKSKKGTGKKESARS